MRLIGIAAILLWLAGCQSVDHVQPHYPAWMAPLPAGFSYYPSDSGATEPHYVIKDFTGMLPTRVVLSYEVIGNGQLVAVDGGSPPTVSLILWRKGDNMTCQGVYQQYRYFGHPRGTLSPGTHTLEVPVDPAAWTDCYGKPGTDFPDRFEGTIDNLWKIGFGFGGNHAGHGVRAPQGNVMFRLIGLYP